MSIPVYVAAKGENRAAARALMATLAKRGYTITHDWTKAFDVDESLRTPAWWEQVALDDLNGVRTCEVFIVLHDERGCGLFVEFGVALALNAPIIQVVTAGDRNIFSHLKDRVATVSSIEEALSVLGVYSDCQNP